MKYMKKHRFFSGREVKVTDSFWLKKIRTVREEMLPYQWEVLHDRVPDAPKSWCIRNFRLAAKVNRAKKQGIALALENTDRGFSIWPEDPARPGDSFYGFIFQDSDLYKWIEAAAYQLSMEQDPELARQVGEAVELISEAQTEDGYLDTYYIIGGMEGAFSNLRDNHELYCFGHLTEAAVALFRATGDTRLLGAAMRFADWIMERLGPEEGKKRGYPGHEIAEMALAALYEATGEEKYYALGKYFIDERGQRPYYYDLERGLAPAPKTEERYVYYQAMKPVRDQREAVGHAVRAVYLYSGMADYAALSGDQSLAEASKQLWEDITGRKMYITGGIGATRFGEAFASPYYLPNELAYAESCASVGMTFFDRRLLQLSPQGRYADDMEKQLYNTVLAGMSLDGKSFFYVNPLEVTPALCSLEERQHVEPVRQRWFGCACCPPNIARLVSSVGNYIASECDDILYIHLFIGCTIQIGDLRVTVESGMPWAGSVRIRLDSPAPVRRTIAVRIPGWCRDTFSGSFPEGTEAAVKNGYQYLTGNWHNDLVEYSFSMEPTLFAADGRVREDIGKAALMRGPICYCLEEKDNGPDLHHLRVLPGGEMQTLSARLSEEPIVEILTEGVREEYPLSGQLYAPLRAPDEKPVTLRWIPYYTWANRGEGEMQVWTRL